MGIDSSKRIDGRGLGDGRWLGRGRRGGAHCEQAQQLLLSLKDDRSWELGEWVSGRWWCQWVRVHWRS